MHKKLNMSNFDFPSKWNSMTKDSLSYITLGPKLPLYRGVGTGEAGEAPASPEIRGWQTNFWGKSAKKLAIFEVASPEIILFLRPCLYDNWFINSGHESEQS